MRTRNLFERHHFQPDDITCGPTSIKMVGDAIGKTNGKSIEDIAAACGTNDQVGTTDVMMQQGMSTLGIPHHIGKSKDVNELAEYLATRQGYIILRTLTQGIKHWIVLYDFSDGQFSAADPWLGDIKYTPDEVLSIWKPRDFYYFEIPTRSAKVVEQLLDRA